MEVLLGGVLQFKDFLTIQNTRLKKKLLSLEKKEFFIIEKEIRNRNVNNKYHFIFD